MSPVVFLAACGASGTSNRIDYQMGERVPLGPLTFNVIETVWRSQLGSDFSVRTPDNRFLLVSLSVTNGGGRQLSLPLLMLEGDNGKQYRELDNGEGLDSWFGLLRSIDAAQTRQGQLLFDVPLGAYRLRLTDGGEPGSEKYAWVTIPLRIDPQAEPGALPESSPGK